MIIPELDVFVVDEIYVNDMPILNRIKVFIDTTEDKIIIATGDCEHLKPANEITSQGLDYDKYMDSVMSQLFKHEICVTHTQHFFKRRHGYIRTTC